MAFVQGDGQRWRISRCQGERLKHSHAFFRCRFADLRMRPTLPAMYVVVALVLCALAGLIWYGLQGWERLVRIRRAQEPTSS
ncbi:MAG: hypothetical protein ACI8UD_004374 [Planctomycetota bacterium]|jgi:hypothetical protein